MKNTILPLQLFVRPEHDDPQPLILYHGRRCPDGYGAALAAWLYYGGQAEFRGLDHGEIQKADDLGELAGRAVYVLDFAFEPELMAEIESRVSKLVVLDHHKSAAEKLSGYQCRCGVVHFDMNKSGARLAWEFFQADKPVPGLIRFIEDRDIWKWEFAESAGFLAALDMEPRSFERWAEIAAFTHEQEAAFMARGGAMDEKFQKLCADISEAAQPLVFNGMQGLMVNCPGMFHSQVGDLLARQSGSFALMWHASTKGVKIGLRSRSEFNCIPLAESFGGGGHAQACGFKMGNERLVELLSGVLKADASADYAYVAAPLMEQPETGAPAEAV
ncbi:DHH family phosphoesterase [Delftia sp. HK171]|uniref:DHH family phosphoesterase n=1 Tax=Delftia sp. HK171 TaxID=1920191 RepID=UPI001152590E|nr:phosphoesterase [Delftia sp. HK171]TQL82711.1 oligoribonuclease NrnB/cAMP/cGMP phosphodiesterase (DHH superfamily) [Delftia sp. HK171]